jgi:hypothetical protein
VTSYDNTDVYVYPDTRVRVEIPIKESMCNDFQNHNHEKMKCNNIISTLEKRLKEYLDCPYSEHLNLPHVKRQIIFELKLWYKYRSVVYESSSLISISPPKESIYK